MALQNAENLLQATTNIVQSTYSTLIEYQMLGNLVARKLLDQTTTTTVVPPFPPVIWARADVEDPSCLPTHPITTPPFQNGRKGKEKRNSQYDGRLQQHVRQYINRVLRSTAPATYQGEIT